MLKILKNVINTSKYLIYKALFQINPGPYNLRGGGGGSKAHFFGTFLGETFGEVLGPGRPTVSELRPAQKLGVK